MLGVKIDGDNVFLFIISWYHNNANILFSSESYLFACAIMAACMYTQITHYIFFREIYMGKF